MADGGNNELWDNLLRLKMQLDVTSRRCTRGKIISSSRSRKSVRLW